MEARAEARYIRVSAQKARLVVDLIRGQKAGEAINILRATNKRIAPTVEKVLRSAIANAENRFNDVDVDVLKVTEAYVNEGPRMKRIRPAPMGRAFRYVRRISHLEIVLAERNRNGQSVATVVGEEEKSAAPKAKAKSKAKAPAKKAAGKKKKAAAK